MMESPTTGKVDKAKTRAHSCTHTHAKERQTKSNQAPDEKMWKDRNQMGRTRELSNNLSTVKLENRNVASINSVRTEDEISMPVTVPV